MYSLKPPPVVQPCARLLRTLTLTAESSTPYRSTCCAAKAAQRGSKSTFCTKNLQKHVRAPDKAPHPWQQHCKVCLGSDKWARLPVGKGSVTFNEGGTVPRFGIIFQIKGTIARHTTLIWMMQKPLTEALTKGRNTEDEVGIKVVPDTDVA
jgi:hypothetical protein